MNNSKHATDPFISRIALLAQRNPEIELLWLYGSRGNDTASKSSDYDLAVAFNTRLEEPVKRRLRPELLTLDWQHALGVGDNVLSIVDINLVPLALAINIIGDNSKVLINKDELRYVRELNRIWGLWSDSQWQDNQVLTGALQPQ